MHLAKNGRFRVGFLGTTYALSSSLHIQRRGHATKDISDTQKRRNRAIATPRARVEHVFGALAQMGGKLVRCLGIVRTTFALHLKAASYNLKRLVFLKEHGVAPF